MSKSVRLAMRISFESALIDDNGHTEQLALDALNFLSEEPSFWGGRVADES